MTTTDAETADLAKAVAAERLTFFSDAVIAIAITLLALELPVPEGTTNRELLHAVAEDRGEYLAFLISFVVIGAHWNGHHRFFRHVERVGGRLGTLTLLWLLMQILTPFATKVLSGDDAFQTRFGFYALVQAVSNLFFLLMVLTVRRRDLLRAGTPSTVVTRTLVRTGGLAAGFVLSIPLSFVSHAAAYACWAVLPLVAAVVVRLRALR